MIEQPAWVMDGNFTSTLDLRLPAANTVVFLDLPRWVTVPRALRRGLRWHGRVRPDMAPACPERVTWEFLLWLWRFPRGGRRRLLTAIATAGVQDRVIRLTGRTAVAQWVHAMSVSTQSENR